jgi:hypothetical protein
MAVSPFDGINRIRFKGSPSRTLSPDQKSGLPRNDIWFSSGRLILELEHAFRNCLDETDCELSQRKPGREDIRLQSISRRCVDESK